MSSHHSRSVENARRFLWDAESGDAPTNDASARSRSTHLSRGVVAGPFSTRDYAVDQSVNLMDQASLGPKQKKGGLFRGSISQVYDEYGDAAPMDVADAEEYVSDDGKRGRGRYWIHQIRQRQRGTRLKALCCVVCGLIAFVLITAVVKGPKAISKDGPDEMVPKDVLEDNNKNDVAAVENEVEGIEEEFDQDKEDNNDSPGVTKPTASSTHEDPHGNHGQSAADVIREKHFREAYDLIQGKILDAGISSKSDFGKHHGHVTPQESALDWLAGGFDKSIEHPYLLERYGLAVLYFATTSNDVANHGASYPWKDSDGWLSGKGFCAWKGVECLPQEQEASAENNYEPITKTYDADNSVTAIVLESNNLRGGLPSELGTAFPELVTIDLRNNQLEGKLPEGLAKAPKLRDLLLGGNQLAGSFPTSYHDLTELHQLDLSDNQFTGSLDGIAQNLVKLRHLSCSGNRFQGSFPDVSSLDKLTGLFVDGNQLHGSLPETLGEATHLLDLRLGDNQFSGKIDHILNKLMNLESLHLGNNGFTGTIPDVFDKLFRLHLLVMPNNKFTGTIPHTLTHLQLLKTLDLDGNRLNGELPGGLGLLTDIVTLSLRDNRFDGTIPTILGKLDDIQTLALNGNQLTGSIPTELGLCFRLNHLHLQNNQLTGDIPSQLGALSGLAAFRLEANAFKGAAMPPQVCALKNDDLSVLAADCSNAKRVSCDCCTECHK